MTFGLSFEPRSCWVGFGWVSAWQAARDGSTVTAADFGSLVAVVRGLPNFDGADVYRLTHVWLYPLPCLCLRLTFRRRQRYQIACLPAALRQAAAYMN